MIWVGREPCRRARSRARAITGRRLVWVTARAASSGVNQPTAPMPSPSAGFTTSIGPSGTIRYKKMVFRRGSPPGARKP